MAGWNDDCPAEAGDSVSCRLYVAEGGDSLANIAMAFSVSLEDVSLAGLCCCCRVLRLLVCCVPLASNPHLHLLNNCSPLPQLRNVNAELAAADQNAIIQPGMGVRVPPFTEGCGAGERARSTPVAAARLPRALPAMCTHALPACCLGLAA